MVFRIIVYSCILLSARCMKPMCLTGYMTDVQSWVDEKGVLTNTVEYHTSIDLSANANPVPILQQKMNVMRSSAEVKYLSLARCRLTRVPAVFHIRDAKGRGLSETVEYVTFYGNSFQDISSPGALYDVSINASRARERVVGMGYQRNSNAVWSTGLREIKFLRLKELDLRACSIQVLSGYIFEGMSNLQALYLGENEVVYIDANAFVGLNNLIHLDFSKNEAYDETGNFKLLTTETFYVLEPMQNLASLDFSFTKMSHSNTLMFKVLGPQLTRLSLCKCGLLALEDDFFNQTSLRILDLSENNGILSRNHVLRGLEDTLEVLYVKESAVRSVDALKGFSKLDILNLQKNEITSFGIEVAETLASLRILDLDMNRLVSWLGHDIFSLMPKLELLSLRENNINIISDDMMKDLAHVRYLGLSGNFIVCNCHARDFMDLAMRNEKTKGEKYISTSELVGTDRTVSFHIAYSQYNEIIKHRVKVTANCSDEQACYEDLNEDVDGNFLLLDYHSTASYKCLQIQESKSVELSEVIGCNRLQRMDIQKEIARSQKLLYLLLMLPVLMIAMAVGFMFRRNLRYFYKTVRNSALLSVINKNEVLNENAIFHYDVFVSYCNEDRHWVLDHLLPQLERGCSISACLHERDFQVGHSILENIVSCMDRSRSIMLVISQKFLLSQWCQFEMHLAQHRLLETRREDLTLVLLEEVPRRLRPNTLHYLMLTKTYIVWPKDENERALFWKRLKKTLVTIKMKQIDIEGVSIA